MTKTKESKLEQDIERFMQRKGIWQLARYQAQSNQNGLPDRMYLYKGYLLGLELKTDEGKLEIQKFILQQEIADLEEQISDIKETISKKRESILDIDAELSKL